MFVALTFYPAGRFLLEFVSCLIMLVTERGREVAISEVDGGARRRDPTDLLRRGLYIGLVALALGLGLRCGGLPVAVAVGLPPRSRRLLHPEASVVMRGHRDRVGELGALGLCAWHALSRLRGVRMRPVEGLRYE